MPLATDAISGIKLHTGTTITFQRVQRAVIIWGIVVAALWMVLAIIMFIAMAAIDVTDDQSRNLQAAGAAFVGISLDTLFMGFIAAYVAMPGAVRLIPYVSDGLSMADPVLEQLP